MKLHRTAATSAEPLDPRNFTGEGTRRSVATLPPGTVNVVSFEPGARTNWHSHSDGQVLFVLEGTGRTATRTEDETSIGEGDVVYVSPGEEHWHGAAVDAAMRHLALSLGETVWLEPVD